MPLAGAWRRQSTDDRWRSGDAGLDKLGGYSITVLFVLTGLPALMLAFTNRAPRAALALALAFPAAFLVLLVGGRGLLVLPLRALEARC